MLDLTTLEGDRRSHRAARARDRPSSAYGIANKLRGPEDAEAVEATVATTLYN